LSRLRVEAVRLAGLEAVAQSAREPKVLFIVGTSGRFGNDVFDLQNSHDQVLRAQAIAATIARLLANAPAQFLR
jgi:hypothetical protein